VLPSIWPLGLEVSSQLQAAVARTLPQSGDVKKFEASHLSRNLVCLTSVQARRGWTWPRKRTKLSRDLRHFWIFRRMTAAGQSASRAIRTSTFALLRKVPVVPTASYTGAWHSNRQGRATQSPPPFHQLSPRPRNRRALDPTRCAPIKIVTRPPAMRVDHPFEIHTLIAWRRRPGRVSAPDRLFRCGRKSAATVLRWQARTRTGRSDRPVLPRCCQFDNICAPPIK